MFRKMLLIALAALVSSACSTATARALVDVSVVDRDSGQWLPKYPYRGDTWVAGTPGSRYSVRLANTTGERVLVVLSVDGVNAVTGQTANPAQAGYVLEPWESAEISGWRKSMDDIAQFVFTDLGDSYAARTGRPHNVGVIGVAVFQELQRRPYTLPPPPVARGNRYRQPESKAAASAAESEAAADSIAQQRMGTGHGEREWSPVGQTHFQRASPRPAQASEIRYDEVRRLYAMGVIPRGHNFRQPYSAPRAFPDGFVADPPSR